MNQYVAGTWLDTLHNGFAMISDESDPLSRNLTLEKYYSKRLKELDLFYLMSSVVSDTSSSLQHAIKKIVDAMPAAWMHADICEVSVHYGDILITTPRYHPTQWSLHQTGTAYDGTPLEIEVVYLEDRPVMVEGSFLNEERMLLNSITELILSLVNKKLLLQNFRKKEKESSFLAKKSAYILSNAPIPIFEVLPDYSICQSNQALAAFIGESEEKLKGRKLSDFTILSRSGGTGKEAFERGSLVSGELELHVPSGDKAINYFYLPLSGPDGTVQSLINYYIDKTEQVTAIRDIVSLIDAAKAGDLGTRINTEHFSGEFRQLTEGINATLDAVIGPTQPCSGICGSHLKGRHTPGYH